MHMSTLSVTHCVALGKCSPSSVPVFWSVTWGSWPCLPLRGAGGLTEVVNCSESTSPRRAWAVLTVTSV